MTRRSDCNIIGTDIMIEKAFRPDATIEDIEAAMDSTEDLIRSAGKACEGASKLPGTLQGGLPPRVNPRPIR